MANVVWFETRDGLVARQTDGWNHEVFRPWLGGWDDGEDIDFMADVSEIPEDRAKELIAEFEKKHPRPGLDATGSEDGWGDDDGEAVEESFKGMTVLVVGDPPAGDVALLEGAIRLSQSDLPDLVVARGSRIRKRARALDVPARSWVDVPAGALDEATVAYMDPAAFAVWSRAHGLGR